MRIRDRRGVSILSTCAAMALLAGCAVGPDFARPTAPKVDGYTREPLAPETAKADVAGGAAQRFTPGEDIPGQWWTLFHSEPLNGLIGEALKANPDLQSAQAALHAALENVPAQEGAYYPSINANFTASRYHSATQPAPPLVSFEAYSNLYAAQVAATWTIDLWGGNRRAVEALQAAADAQRFQLEGAYLALTSGVVGAAVQEASLRGQIAATQEIIKSEAEALDILRRQFALGQVADADVAAQEAALSLAEGTLPPLEKQLGQQRDLLTVLAGRLSSEEVTQTFDLASLQLPEDLPVTLPSKLVEQRPDIRTAEENLHAASAQVGVAIANMLPNITLSANNGTSATQIGALFAPGNGYWTLASSITQPIFEGGTLLHKTRAARALLEQAAAQYRSTVDTAFQNVADALLALQSDAKALTANVATERAAARTLDITRQQLELGQVAYLALLNAEETYQQAVINRVQAQAQRYADTAALFQALGGGWWNRSDVAPAQTVSATSNQR